MPPPLNAGLVPGSPFVIGAQAGADYADLNLFQVAQAKDLETPNQRIQAHLQDGHFDVSSTTFDAAAGWVTSKENHVEITCEPGAEHDGTYAGRKCGIYASNYSSGAVFNISCWVHRIALGTSGPYGTNLLAVGEVAAVGDTFYLEELVCNTANGREAIQVNCTGGTTAFLANISVVNVGNDFYGIWQQNAGTNFFYAITLERTGTAAGFRNEYGADITYKNCIVYGGGAGAGYSGASSAGTDYNISDDATAPGTNFKRGITPSFVAPNDNHLDPSDTVAKGWGEDLSADVNYPVAIDIDHDPRPAPGQWDCGCDQVAVAGPIPLEGAITAAAQVSSAPRVIVNLTAAISASASVNAAPVKTAKPLEGAITANAQVGATLTRRTFISESILPSASLSVTLTKRTFLAAAITSGAVVTATPEAKRGLYGAVSPSATVGATLKRTRRTSAAILASADARVSSEAIKLLEGAISASASVGATLKIKIRLAAAISAAVAVNAAPLAGKKLFPEISGGATVFASLTLISDVKTGLEDILEIPGSGAGLLVTPGTGEKTLKSPGSGPHILEV